MEGSPADSQPLQCLLSSRARASFRLSPPGLSSHLEPPVLGSLLAAGVKPMMVPRPPSPGRLTVLLDCEVPCRAREAEQQARRRALSLSTRPSPCCCDAVTLSRADLAPISRSPVSPPRSPGDAAIATLNSAIKMDVQAVPPGPPPRLAAMRRHLEALGIAQPELSRLNMVHVTGTKGKGSTCAFIESILRAHGRKTGLYTSPHLVSHTERIKINGRSLSQDKFAESFWRVHDALLAGERRNDPMSPNYFETLTIMAFDVFVRERVDVAVVEVGAGGRCDPTNVADAPAVCAVTPIGLDHVRLLGSTRDAIAREKSGIFKPLAPAVVSPDQYPEAMEVLRGRAAEASSPLVLAPALGPHELPAALGLDGDFQAENAAVAAAVCREWMARCGRPGETVDIARLREALAGTRWPGRAQRLALPNAPGVELFLDGAHTVESARACGRWFESRAPAGTRRALVFAAGRARGQAPMLGELVRSGATRGAHVVFTTLPSTPGRPVPFHSAEELAEAWRSVGGCEQSASVSLAPLGPEQAIAQVRALAAQGSGGVSCLVTGSLYLLGVVLAHCRYEID
eukprot:m51a1_g7006 putative folylpolyglutamate mitochondrial-like (571) ;mRNA; r:230436-233038